MPQRCRTCSRINPDEARYCYHDGVALDLHGRGPLALGAQPFVSPFVFPSGRVCRTFDELVLACEADWEAARQMLGQGYLETFLAAAGRVDLAAAARRATQAADLDRSLDELLNKMPGDAREPPHLYVQPQEINLGRVRRDEDHRFVLHLENQGMGLLTGSVSTQDTPWLVLGDGGGSPRKVFQCRHDFHLPVRVHGKALRAGNQPLEGKLAVTSAGGRVVVTVRVEVAVQPFVGGVLAGACSPRQAAEKARASPREAAPLFERGEVAVWYESNGWTYPVQGPSASGLGAVQQFFEALGLAKPPRVEISENVVRFSGSPGTNLQHALVLQAVENRPVFAHATTGAAWLKVGRAQLHGRVARIPLVVPEVPPRPGELLAGKVVVTANGNQRFVVEITLDVAGRASPAPPTFGMTHPLPSYLAEEPSSDGLSASQAEPPNNNTEAPIVRPLVVVEIPTEPAEESVLPTAVPSYVVPKDDVVERKPLVEPAPFPPRRGVRRHLIPLGLLAAALLTTLVHDLLLPPEDWDSAAQELIDPNPLIEARFHDGPKDEKDEGVPATMRFGLVMLRERDPAHPDKPKKLTFDEWGRSNNTCLRVDSEEVLFGQPPGRFVAAKEPLGPDTHGRPRNGVGCRWELPRKKVLVTQEVEIVPGEQSRKRDTCLVRYILENKDRQPHRVGIRFLLDTFIGANDGVPFTIPGAAGLCDTQMLFATDAEVPDFIQALENDDLLHPGTVAHLQFKVGHQIESPTKVQLGGWPNHELQQFGFEKAKDMLTLWEVPLIDMRGLDHRAQRIGRRADPDSAVTMYWEERPLPPGKRREVGFAYGLGAVSSGEGGGRLLLTVGGRLVRGGEFTLTALVQNPLPDERLTLTLPPGFKLVEGTAEQVVPPVPAGATRPTSPVTWRVRAADDGRYELLVRSNHGAAQKQPVIIRTKGVFD
jgi:hypothetical protein